jgi:hypothetical protein
LPRRETAAQWLDAHPDASRLAAMLSLAAMADPWLVRECRVWLGLGVEVELDVWFSPLGASSTSAGIVFEPGALEELRERLKKDKPLLAKAWEFTSQRHPSISPAVREEEKLTYAALTRDAAAVAGDAERVFNKALVSVVRGGQTQLAAWAARALPRLPESVRNVRSARYLATAAQAHGYPTPPSVPTAGAPPAWMTGSSRQELVPIGVALYASQLVLHHPPAERDAVLQAPRSRRVWISWRNGDQRASREVVLPLNRPVVIAAHAAEFVIEAPGAPAYLIQDKAVLGNIRSVRIELQSPSEEPLAKYVERQLQLRDHHVARSAAPGAPDPDYVVYIGRTKPAVDVADCISRIYLRAPGAPIWLQKSGETEQYVSFADRDRWDVAMWRLLDILSGPPLRPGELSGVPELPSYYVPDREAFALLRDQLLHSDSGVITLIGEPGAGRTVLASGVLRDCAIRRRFHGGIFWFHSDNEWPANPPDSSCFVVNDPYREHLTSIFQHGQLGREPNSRILLLLRTEEGLPPQEFRMWVGPRKLPDLIEMFTRVSGAAEAPPWLFDLWMGLPKLADNSARVWGAALRAGMPADQLFSFASGRTSDWLDRARSALLNLELLEPFCAWPPTAPLAGPEESIWQRYFAGALEPNFPPVLQPTVRHGFELLTRVGLKPGVEMPHDALTYTVELAAPTHERIVGSYEEECGGDWAIAVPGDGYYGAHFAYHLFRARPEAFNELTENIDWLLRASREKPDWMADIHLLSPEWTSEQEQTSEYAAEDGPAGKRPRDLEEAKSGELGIAGRMARGRLRLRGGKPVRVVIAGTGRRSGLDPVVHKTAVVLGRELARYGYGLTTGGWPGVDYVASDAYAAQLATWDIPVELGLLHVVADDARPDFPRGSIFRVRADRTVETELEEAAALIAIGGEGGTLDMCRTARARSVPVYPIRRTGGDAETFYRESGLSDLPPNANEILDLPLDSNVAIYQFAKELIPLLPFKDTEAERLT